MENHQDKPNAQNTFLGAYQFDATTDLGKSLLQLIQLTMQRFTRRDPVFLGALTYCLDRMSSHHLRIEATSLLFWQKVSLKRLIETELHLAHNESVNAYKKIIYFSAFLNFIKENFAQHGLSITVYEDIKACAQTALAQLKQPIAALKKKRPQPSALKKNFSALLTICQTNTEVGADRDKFVHLLAVAAKEASLLDDAADYGYKVRFGTVLYLLSQLDQTKVPHFYAVCQATIHVDELHEISNREKLDYLSGLFFVIPKIDPDQTVFYNMEFEIQKQVLQQMIVLNYSKYALDSIQQLGVYFGKTILPDHLNQYLQNSFRYMGNLIHKTRGQFVYATQYSSAVTHSLFNCLPGLTGMTPKWEEDHEFIDALLALPDELLSEVDKNRIRDSVIPNASPLGCLTSRFPPFKIR
jgi:uncharacterized protein YqfB (UPF0267 family)